MKKFLFIILVFILLVAGFIIIRFGSALSQEGNPTPILVSIGKLEWSNSDYELFSKSDDYNRYVSKNTGSSRYDVIKEMLKVKGWDYKEQMGSGLVFDNGEENIVISTRQYTKHYILWDIPK